MVKPPLRTKSIGFKVSEEEYARLEEAARAGGFTLGEWCRQVVLEDASGEEIKPTGAGAEAQALMAELVALGRSCSMCSSSWRTGRSQRRRRCNG